MAPPKSKPTPKAPPPKAAKAPKSGAKAASGRNKTDWEAVERDYRTGKFTLRELETKHGVTNSLIGRNAKKHGWTQDLAVAIKHATNARLMDELVRTESQKGAQEYAKSAQEVTNTVLAVAEQNTQVILGHRKDIKDTRQVAANLLAEVSTTALMAQEQDLLAKILAGDKDAQELKDARQVVRKALDFANRVASVKSLAETFTKLQAAERVAFRLDDDPAEKVDHEAERYARMSMTERAARLALIMEKARKKAEEIAGESQQ
jgi:hypothetical protein